MAGTTYRSQTHSDQLIQVLSQYEQVLIVMHDNPDPDAIATGWALYTLIEERLGKPVRLIGGGAIVRAENKYMVELLSPPIQLVSEIIAEDNVATVLVDCSVGTTNQLLTRAGIDPVGVIDHHLNGSSKVKLPFKDIRTDVVASACIAATYLREQGVEPGMKLATAVLYAMRSETAGCETRYTPLDRSVVRWLTDQADPTLLAEIENAPLEREYFSDLVLAMESTYVFGDTAICFLPQASGAEIVGEVADLLVRCRGIQRVLCSAIIGSDLLLSARTAKEFGNASKLLSTTLEGLGGCGGHEHRAGGKIPGVACGSTINEELRLELHKRWLTTCGVESLPGSRLIARRDSSEES